MQACPNINSPEWDDLVKRTDLHTAYSMFMKYGNGAPYVGNRERNKTISEIEKEFNLTKYSTINGTVVKKYRGFYRDSTAKLVQDIRNKYTGDYTIKRISPSEGMKGEFALKVEGFPLLKSSVNYNVPKEKMHLEMLKAEFIKNYEEANEHILPSDPDRYDYLIDSRYQQRAATSISAQVNYRLKATEILLSDKAKQVFKKGEKNGWDLNKILTDLQIPKEQKQLILDLGITDREQIVLELASKYSYSVEINTAKTKEINDSPIDDDTRYYTKEGKYYKSSPFENDAQPLEISKEQYESYTTLDKPTQHYSNLTVPGGTNYTENEISTPLITPSIKGHAQFSTDNGIGWFRSDDKAVYTGINKVQDGLDDNNNPLFVNEDGSNDIPTKIRRVLELQSDLFQKGRDQSNIVPNKTKLVNFGENLLTYDEWTKENNLDRRVPHFDEYEKYYDANKHDFKTVTFEDNTTKNQFLQLLNKNNNWVTFFIKSIIQDSAVKGYEKVLFPKGETAARIEGHETLANELNNINKNILQLENYKPTIGDFTPDYMIQGGIEIQNASDLDLVNKAIQSEIDTLENRKKELKSEGIEKLKPIEAFYEIKVGNILKKQGYSPKEVMDEYGNKWNEIEVIPARDLSEFSFSRSRQFPLLDRAKQGLEKKVTTDTRNKIN
ncbi:MAG: hypothetical protein WC973_03580, partial [Candidatus Dojkabacteria bacterium]